MKKVGIMGGTFNPIHMGHLIAAQEVLERMEFDEILFIPTGNPPHKAEEEVVEASYRLDMVKLAIEGNNRFKVSDIEVNRVGKTYTYDTLIELKSASKDTSFYFIVGYDTLRDMDTWKRVDDVFKLSSFVVVTRGNDNSEMREEIERKVNKYRAKIFMIDIPNIQISSTEIRNKIFNKKSIKYIVHDKTIEYIYANGLYRGE